MSAPSNAKKIGLEVLYSTSPGAEKILSRSKESWSASKGRHLIMLEMKPGCSLHRIIVGPAGIGFLRVLAGNSELFDEVKSLIDENKMNINVLPEIMSKLTVVVPRTQLGVYNPVAEPNTFVRPKVFNQFNRFVNNQSSNFRILVAVPRSSCILLSLMLECAQVLECAQPHGAESMGLQFIDLYGVPCEESSELSSDSRKRKSTDDLSEAVPPSTRLKLDAL